MNNLGIRARSLANAAREVLASRLRWTCLMLLVATVVNLLVGYRASVCGILRVEFAGNEATFKGLLGSSCGHLSRDSLTTALTYDFAFIPVYVVSLWLIVGVGGIAYAPGPSRKLFNGAAWLVVVAGVFDLLENASMLIALHADLSARGRDQAWALTTGMATVKFIALLPALALSALTLSTALSRVAAIGWRRIWPTRPPEVAHAHGERPSRSPFPTVAGDGPSTDAKSGQEAATDDRSGAWRVNFRLPPEHLPPEPGLGISLSGGGIRAATFALGAVQSLVSNNRLDEARFMTTVSGGGYFGSALQMLRWKAAPLPLREAFKAGSAEEDHLRRHGRYIADGAAEWVRALAVVARNSVLGLALVYSVLVLLSWCSGWIYSLPTEWSQRLFPTGDGPDPSVWPRPDRSLGYAVAIPLVLAYLIWLISPARTLKVRQVMVAVAGALVGLAVAAVVLCAGIPWAVALVRTVFDLQTSNELIGATAATVLSVATTVWTAVNTLRPTGDSGASAAADASKKKRASSAASRFSRQLLTFAVLAGVGSAALLTYLLTLRSAITEIREGPSMSELAVPVGAAAFLLLSFLGLDQTRMSLHPFYRRRLASAYGVWRHADGSVTEEPWTTMTSLSSYGHSLMGSGDLAGGSAGPHGMRLVLCASAHVSGQQASPPGRRVVPFVFSSDFMGGPGLGYLKTSDVETLTSGTAYRPDITLQAASAISGAAFASSLGRHSSWYDLLLSLSNARLGAWLPNPYYHLQRNTQAEAKDDDIPAQEGDRNPVPRIRRITYYAREVLRIHPIKDRFVYVTDGGHYENLGLVELFRRQCTEIISVDASGDRGLPRALSDAVALAYEELGVVVRIEGFSLAEHSAEDGTEANEELRDLESRMTTSSVLVGEYWYPWMDHDERGHRLVIGKARLGQDLAQEPLMFPLQSYATSHPDFPSDSTGDQWFEVDQFQAYLMLGQLVGAAMSAQLEQPWPPSEPPV